MSKDDLSDFVTAAPGKDASGRKGSGPIIHGIAWSLTMALLVFVVPRLEAVFKDFGVDLPGLSKIAIKVSHFAVTFAVVLVPLLVALMVLDGQVLAALSRRGEVGKRLTWSVVMLAIPLLVLVLVLVGLVLPLITLETRLSG